MGMPSLGSSHWTYGRYAHSPQPRLGMSRSGCPRKRCRRFGKMDMPSPGRSQWAYGRYAHSPHPRLGMSRSGCPRKRCPAGSEKWVCLPWAAATGHALQGQQPPGIWLLCPLLAPRNGHVPIRWAAEALPRRFGKMDISSPGSSHWTYGRYAHSSHRKLGMSHQSGMDMPLPRCRQFGRLRRPELGRQPRGSESAGCVSAS
jgi:hypothetical protein